MDDEPQVRRGGAPDRAQAHPGGDPVRRPLSPRARTTVARAAVAPVLGFAALRGLELDVRYPLSPLVTFTPHALVLGVPPAVAIAAGLRRPAPAVAAGLAGLAMLKATGDRVLAGPGPEVAPRGPTLTILSANTLGDRGDARTYVRLVREHDVDIFSVQELTPGQAGRLGLEGLGQLLPQKVIDPRPEARGGGLYSRHPLTRQPTGDVDLPRVRPIQPEALVGIPGAPPTVIKSVHPIPPVSRLATPHWADTLRRLPAAEDGRLRVLAGDFNATLDHKALRHVIDRGYTDAADATGDGWRPTWPVGERRPPITIDHVLVDRRIAVEHYSVHAVPGSDHRALLVRLRLPAA